MPHGINYNPLKSFNMFSQPPKSPIQKKEKKCFYELLMYKVKTYLFVTIYMDEVKRDKDTVARNNLNP